MKIAGAKVQAAVRKAAAVEIAGAGQAADTEQAAVHKALAVGTEWAKNQVAAIASEQAVRSKIAVAPAARHRANSRKPAQRVETSHWRFAA